LSFQVSCSYGPGRYDAAYEQRGHDYPLGYVRWTEQRNFEAILAMLAAGSISFDRLLTHRFDVASAAEAYRTIQSDPSALGVVLEYSSDASRDRTVRIGSSLNADHSRRSASAAATTSDGLVVAVIGAGNFT